MNTPFNSEDSAKIEKSNKAFEILASLPKNQREDLIEGLLATLQLSKSNVKSTLAGFWWDIKT